MIETKEKTAPYPFVGANGGQSSQTTDDSISESAENYNSNSDTDEDIDKCTESFSLTYVPAEKEKGSMK